MWEGIFIEEWYVKQKFKGADTLWSEQNHLIRKKTMYI